MGLKTELRVWNKRDWVLEETVIESCLGRIFRNYEAELICSVSHSTRRSELNRLTLTQQSQRQNKIIGRWLVTSDGMIIDTSYSC